MPRKAKTRKQQPSAKVTASDVLGFVGGGLGLVGDIALIGLSGGLYMIPFMFGPPPLAMLGHEVGTALGGGRKKAPTTDGWRMLAGYKALNGAAKARFTRVMNKFAAGNLKTGTGAKVEDERQALAIAQAAVQTKR